MIPRKVLKHMHEARTVKIVLDQHGRGVITCVKGREAVKFRVKVAKDGRVTFARQMQL